MTCHAWNCRHNCDGECIDTSYVEIDSYGQCTNYKEWGDDEDEPVRN